MTVTVRRTNLGRSFELTEEEHQRLEAAMQSLEADADEFFTQVDLWTSANHPELRENVAAEFNQRAAGTSSDSLEELKTEAVAEYLRRQTMLFVEFVLSDSEERIPSSGDPNRPDNSV